MKLGVFLNSLKRTNDYTLAGTVVVLYSAKISLLFLYIKALSQAMYYFAYMNLFFNVKLKLKI